MKIFKHASLCSGIGAAELAASWMGWKNEFSVEIDDFCNKVLKYHYPNAVHYGNIFEQDFREWRGRVDVLTAGFPCQPFSCAGKRNGAEDDRYLWPQVLRVIEEIRPTWFVGENVGGILSMVLTGEETKVGSYTDVCGENYTFYEKRQRFVIEQIRIDLASIGYSVQPVVIPACAVGAPHRRDRVWFLARRDDVTDTDGNGHSSRGESKESKECRCGNISQQEKRGNSTEWIDGLFRFSRFTPDTDGAGLQETGIQQRAAGIAGDGLQRDVTNSQRVRSNEVLENLQPEQPDGKGITLVSSERFAADAESTGIKGERDKGQGKIQFNRRDLQSVRPSWQNFPTTEPAIRRGDDGISGRLSGITFSRWRQESIKALGNSMVAPLVYEIFLAIEQVEQIK